MTAMASILLIDDKERWLVLTDKTVRVHKAKGDEKILLEIALSGVSREFNVFDDDYKLFLHGNNQQPQIVTAQTQSLSLACDWWFHLTKAVTPLNVSGRDLTPLTPLSTKHANAELISKFYSAFAAKDWFV